MKSYKAFAEVERLATDMGTAVLGAGCATAQGTARDLQWSQNCLSLSSHDGV